MTTAKTKSIRFATLIRVSTEAQEKKKTSLIVQKEAIEKAVYEDYKGKIVAWYGGQEHATAGYEKKEVDRLLKDATEGKFDAIMVDRVDRWSRDNSYSSKGLDIFTEKGIRFFAGINEYDLFNPSERLFVEMNVVLGSYFARSIKRESRRVRIKKAKKGEPSTGLLPFGRKFNKDTKKWGIDEEKQLLIEDAAMRYLASESIPHIADDYNMDASGLHKTLMHRCGDTWEQKFRNDKTKEYEVFTTKIPRLLPERIIKAIHKKAEANKTYSHGRIKNQFLLSRMIFCKHCGCALFGQKTSSGYTYYRHVSKKHANKSAQRCKRPEKCNNISTKAVEDTVLAYLYDMFGNPAAVKEAVEAAIPDMKQVEADRRRLIEVQNLLKKIESKRSNLLNAVADGIFNKVQIQSKAQDLDEQEERLIENKHKLTDKLVNLPSSKDVKTASMKLATVKRGAKLKPYSEMSDTEKRYLLELVFGGKTPEGKRQGIYIKWHEPKHWSFSIHGQLIDENDLIELSKQQREALFDLEGGGTAYKQKELLTKEKEY